MAAKRPLFHVSEWERKQKQKQRAAKTKPTAKRTKSEKQLSDAVRRYNERIARAIKSGKLAPEKAPKRASVAEIKKSIASDLTPLQRGRALSEAARQLEKSRERNAFEIVKTAGGVEVTRLEYEKAMKNFEAAKRKQAAEEAKRVESEAAAPAFGGVPVKEPRAWGEGVTPGNPETAESWARFQERAEAAVRYLRAGEWELYRQDLIKNYEKHYSGANLARLKEALKHISNGALEMAYRAGADFANQDYQYESEPNVESMLAVMANWADI